MSRRRCDPPTTPQTIGRLETGTRTVSVGWLNRIARALGVEAQDLVEAAGGAELKVAAILGAKRRDWRRRGRDRGRAPRPKTALIAVLVAGEPRRLSRGDEIWCETLAAGRLCPRAQPRRPGPAARRPLPVRPADQPRRGKAPDPPARSRRPSAGRRQPAMDRRRGEAGPSL